MILLGNAYIYAINIVNKLVYVVVLQHDKSSASL